MKPFDIDRDMASVVFELEEHRDLDVHYADLVYGKGVSASLEEDNQDHWLINLSMYIRKESALCWRLIEKFNLGTVFGNITVYPSRIGAEPFELKDAYVPCWYGGIFYDEDGLVATLRGRVCKGQ